MTKKILLIIGILVIIAVAVFLVLGERREGEGETQAGFSFRDYFPFGRNDEPTPSAPSDENEGKASSLPVASSENQPVPRLRKISNEPVAGAAVFNNGTTSIVRWVEKGTGNVYEARSDVLAVVRLTNTTIPQIIRAIWLHNGAGFLAQTLVPESEIIETSFVSLAKTPSGTDEVLTPYVTQISKLQTGIKEVSVSPDNRKILYYVALNSASFYTSNPDGTGQTLIVTHPLTEWLPRYWTSGTSVLIQTKEGASTPAYFYNLNLSNGTFTKITNPMSLITRSLFTLAEKCALPTDNDSFVYCAVPDQTPSGTYPDDWYKGAVSTADSIRKMDTEHDVYYNTANLSVDSGQRIDVTDIKISPDQSHLIFRNKIDGYLWLLRIEE